MNASFVHRIFGQIQVFLLKVTANNSFHWLDEKFNLFTKTAQNSINWQKLTEILPQLLKSNQNEY